MIWVDGEGVWFPFFEYIYAVCSLVDFVFTNSYYSGIDFASGIFGDGADGLSSAVDCLQVSCVVEAHC